MSQKILVVDDSRTIRRAVELIYHGSSYEVVGASTASDALAALSQHRPVAAIIDYHLPDQSGLDFCAELRQNPAMKDVALVVLGGKHHPFDPKRVATVGANAYIMKPFKTDPFMEAVTNAISNLRGRPSLATPGAIPAVPSVRAQGGPPPPPPDSRRASPPPPPRPVVQPAAPVAAEVEVEVEQIVAAKTTAAAQSEVSTGARPVEMPQRPAAVAPTAPAPSPQRPAAIAPAPSPQRPAAIAPAPSPQRPAAIAPAPSPQRPAPGSQQAAAASTEQRAISAAQPGASASVPPQSIAVEVSEEMVRDAVRQVVPDIVRQVLATLLRETIGPRVETYARRKIDDFVEKDLPQLADEAIERQLAALTGEDGD
ncbi:MAG: DNA-binding response OmpR family regulator [Bradymonadia bacterium]|jgi:DNA-binding response OmpR family regulator